MNKFSQQLNIVLVAGIVGAAAALSSFHVIADDSAQARQGHHKGKFGQRLFTKLDANEDGELSLTEMTDPIATRAEKKLARKDADEDGVISFEEATANRRDDAIELWEFADDIVACVADIKAESGDDSIIVPEADSFKSPQQKFDSVDTSLDGFIDLAELEVAMENKATTSFSAMDADGNGSVTEEEYTAHVEARKATRQAIRTCVEELENEEDVL